MGRSAAYDAYYDRKEKMNIQHSLRFLMLPLVAIDNALPAKGIIYEIGCGMGVISLYLGKNPKRRMIGTDLNATKIKQIQVLKKSANVTFVTADAAKFKYEKCGGAVLSDFLHHVPYETQEKILKKLVAALNKNGIIVIKEINKKDGIRMWMSRFWDLVFYPKDTIYYREKNDLRKLLSNLGLTVNVKREVPWFPGSTFLFVCRKN